MLEKPSSFLGSPCAHAIIVASLLIMILCGCVAPVKEKSQPPTKASVLLITLDTTRADRLGCYGSDRGLTPFLDGFSKEAYLFENCETPVPLTLPAHTSLLSGLYPQHTNVQSNISNTVPMEVPLIQEAFSAAGFETAAFISSAVMLRRYGLDRGFDEYDQSFYQPRLGQYQRASAEKTLARADAWLSGRKGPFFCWIHLYDPHYPYEPPEPWAAKFKSVPYDGAVAYMDSALSDFFRKPAMAGWKNWQVIICADHGESLGDHGEMRHGVLIYEPTTRVPMMIHIPGQSSQEKIKDWVSLIDVAPTIIEMNRISGKTLDGVSLTPLMNGRNLPARPIFLSSLGGTLTFGWAPLYGVVSSGKKYIEAPRPELYDLKADPLESSSLIESDPDSLEYLKKDVKNYILFKPVGEKKSAKNLSGKDLEQLAGLGYIEPGFSASGVYRKDPKDYIELEDKFINVSEAFRKKDYKRAETIIKDIERKDPDNSYLFFYKGKLGETRSFEEASKAYARSIELNPSAYLAWSMLIRLNLNAGKIHEAAGIARKALQACRDDLGYFNVALAEEALLDGKNAAEVRRYLDEALKIAPDFSRAHMVSFELALLERNKEQAESDVMRVWKFGTQAEVNSWRKDPVFKNFFDATPAGAGNDAPDFGDDPHALGPY